MKTLKWIIAILAFPSLAGAANLTNYWYTDGGLKVAQQDLYPLGTCSTCTITRVWDGNMVKQFSAQGETIGGALYLLAGGGSNATGVNVTVSSLTCQSGTGIVSTVVSSMNVTDTTTRPTQVFLAKYLQMVGTSDLPYGHSEFNKNMWPPNFRSDGTLAWTSRRDHDKFYPHGLVPMEEFAVSSFTVAKTSSQVVWIDTYVSSSIPAGNCDGTITIKEGVTVSTAIPYRIKVYGFQMPDHYTFPATVYVDPDQIDARFNGGSVDTAGRRNVQQLLHAHGFSSTMGDVPDVNTQRFPSTKYKTYLDGSAFTTANGYGNARAYGKGHSLYMIGTYNSQHGDPGYSETNAVPFCTYHSSWSANLSASLYPNLDRVATYFSDEASSSTMANTIEKQATWISTSCAHSGATIHSWVTGSFPTINKYAPHVDMPVSASIYGNDPNHPYPGEAGYAYIPSSWQAAADQYLTTGSSQAWRYNDQVFGSGACPKPEEEGYVCRMNMWATWIKLCGEGTSPGVCKGGWFDWHANYWKDENNANNNNDLFNVAKTFGYDAFPSTSTQWGHNGFNYTQGDGVLLWPGKDDVVANPSYGFHGGIAVWPLKMIRRGIDDADVMNMAAQVDLVTTSSTVHSLISQALWEAPCTDITDCSYNNTSSRTWSETANNYTTHIETLYQLLESAGTFCGDTICNGSETCSSCPSDCGSCPAIPTSISVEISGGP